MQRSVLPVFCPHVSCLFSLSSLHLEDTRVSVFSNARLTRGKQAQLSVDVETSSENIESYNFPCILCQLPGEDYHDRDGHDDDGDDDNDDEDDMAIRNHLNDMKFNLCEFAAKIGHTQCVFEYEATRHLVGVVHPTHD